VPLLVVLASPAETLLYQETLQKCTCSVIFGTVCWDAVRDSDAVEEDAARAFTAK
jgi:hypothetical protein